MIDQYSFHFEKGIADFQDKNLPSALRSFSKCIQLDPKSKSSYLNHGVICNIKRIYEVAYQDFSSVIEADPWELIAYYNRFVSLVSMRKYGEGLSDLYVSLSLGYVKLGIMKDSIPIVQKGIQLVNNNTQAYLAKGILLQRKERFGEALDCLSTALGFYPEYRLGFSERAAVYRKLNRHQQCEEDIKYVLELSQQEQTTYTLVPTITNLPLKQLIKQIEVRHNEFLSLRAQIFQNKAIFQTSKPNLSTQQLDVFADIMNLPSLHTNSLIEGQLDKSKSFDKENFKKEKLFKEMPKFILPNNSGATDNSDGTLKQIMNNKSDFQSMKTYKSRPEFDSIHESSENTERQIQYMNQGEGSSVERILAQAQILPVSLQANTDQPAECVGDNLAQDKENTTTKENRSQVGSDNSGSFSRRSKAQFTDIEIQISAATLKRSTQLIGSMSPYCQVRYGNEVKKTSVAYYSGKNPVWNHTVKFKILDSRALITFKVFDKQFFKKDDLVGEAVITVYEESNVLQLKYEGEAIGNMFIKMKLI